MSINSGAAPGASSSLPSSSSSCGFPHTGIADAFAHIVTLDDVTAAKPDPANGPTVRVPAKRSAAKSRAEGAQPEADAEYSGYCEDHPAVTRS